MMKNFLVFCVLVAGLYACSPAKIAEKKAAEAAKLEEYLNSVPDTAQVMPLFRGGHHKSFGDWIYANIQYPQKLYDDYINGYYPLLDGRVVANFIIGKDGSTRDVQILESPNRELGDAVRRVILASPKWTPGVDEGVAVNVRYRLPVVFRLSPEIKMSLERQRIERSQAVRSRY